MPWKRKLSIFPFQGKLVYEPTKYRPADFLVLARISLIREKTYFIFVGFIPYKAVILKPTWSLLPWLCPARPSLIQAVGLFMGIHCPETLKTPLRRWMMGMRQWPWLPVCSSANHRSPPTTGSDVSEVDCTCVKRPMWHDWTLLRRWQSVVGSDWLVKHECCKQHVKSYFYKHQHYASELIPK